MGYVLTKTTKWRKPMIYVLIVFENPNPNQQGPWQQWQNILNSLEDAAQNNEQIQKIHENVWLFPLQNELHSFAQILVDSRSREISYHTSFFEEKPLFITS